MKNILFICLLTIINVLIVSCLGLGDSEKCNKFAADYHNPAVDKFKEFESKLSSYNTNIFTLRNNYNLSSDDLSLSTSLDIEDIKDLTYHGTSIATTTLKSAERNFNTVKKLGDELIDDLKKVLDNDSEVCKNKQPSFLNGVSIGTIDFLMRPGQSDYKSKIEKVKKKVEKVIDINKAFRDKVKSDFGL